MFPCVVESLRWRWCAFGELSRLLGGSYWLVILSAARKEPAGRGAHCWPGTYLGPEATGDVLSLVALPSRANPAPRRSCRWLRPPPLRYPRSSVLRTCSPHSWTALLVLPPVSLSKEVDLSPSRLHLHGPHSELVALSRARFPPRLPWSLMELVTAPQETLRPPHAPCPHSLFLSSALSTILLL